MEIEREAFRECLSQASLQFSQYAADRIAVAVEEEAELAAEMEQDSELAELVALQMGLL